MSRRALALILAAVAIIVLIISGVAMGLRIGEFHKLHKRELFAFREVEDRSFTYAGRKVRFEDCDVGGSPNVCVNYGDAKLQLRVQVTGEKKLPGLKPYMDWLRVVRFLPTDGRPVPDVIRDSYAGKVVDRLAIVTRELPPGADPETWGRVWRKDWVFTFYEFKPDGTFVTQRLKFPQTRTWQDARADELKENTWELQAALLLIPKGMGPSYKPQNDAMSAVGWTLPVAGASMLLLLASIVVFAGFRPAHAP